MKIWDAITPASLGNFVFLIIILSTVTYLIVFMRQSEKELMGGNIFLDKLLRNSKLLQHGQHVITFEELPLSYAKLTNRWSNITASTPLPNWTVDSQFAVFSNVTIPKVIEFPLDHLDICKGEVEAVIVVETAGKHIEERYKLRNAIPVPNNWRRVFMVGHPVLNAIRVTTCKKNDRCELDKETETKLLQENEQFKDIVMGDFLDIYQNLTMKTAAIMKWATTRCPNAKFLFKADDDIYPNYPVLEKILLAWSSNNYTNNMWAGGKQWYQAIRRASHTKVSFEEFPGLHYAYYLFGARYAMSMDVAHIMATMTERIAFLPIEDVYMGLCGHFSGLEIFKTDFKLPHPRKNCGDGFYHFGSINSSEVVKTWKSNCPSNGYGSYKIYS